MCIPKKTTKNTKRGTPMPKGRPVEPSRSKSSSLLLLPNKKAEKSEKSLCPTQRFSFAEKIEDKKVATPKMEEKPLPKSCAVKTSKEKTPTHGRWSTAELKKTSQVRRKKASETKERSKTRGTPQKDASQYSLYITVITEQFENAQLNPPTSIDLKKALCNRVSNYAFDAEEEDEDDTLAFVSTDFPTIIFPALQINAEPEVARPKLKHVDRVDETQEG